MNATPGLVVENLSVSLDGRENILNGLDLSVRPGEIVAVVGASGSGKSTLLRTIAGFVKPRTGRILWDGEDVGKLPPDVRNFGLMFQDGQLFPGKNVGENVGYGLKMKRVNHAERVSRAERVNHAERVTRADRERIVAEMLEKVGLGGFAKRQIETLSGGQAQRVALARSLAPKPRLIMLDEPLSSLDSDLRSSLAKEISNLIRESGAAGILVTHDRSEAATMADRVMLLNDQGKLSEIA